MTKKRIIFFLILIALLLISGGILYYFYQLNKNSKLYEYIPDDADVVIFINTQNLIKKQLFEKRDTGLFSQLKNKLEELPYFKDVKSPDELGIDVFSGVALVESKHIKYCLLKLKDEDQFASYLDKKKTLFKAIKSDKGNHLYITHDSLLYIGYNSDYLAIMLKEGKTNETDFFNVLQVKLNKSFAQTSHFKICKNDTAFAWFYDNKKILSQRIAYNGIFEFQEGFTIKSCNLSSKLSNFPDKSDTSMHLGNVIYVGKEKLLHPKFYKQIERFSQFFDLSRYDDDYANLDFEKSKYLFLFAGTAINDKTTISYQYDENFNKKTVFKTIKDTFESCNLYIEKDERERFFTNNMMNASTKINWPNDSYVTFITLDEQVFKYIVPIPIKFKLNAWCKTASNGGYCYLNIKFERLQDLKF